MNVTLLQTCRIGLFTMLLTASFPEAGLAGIAGTLFEGKGNRFEGKGNRYVFLVSSTPLASSRGG